MPAPARDIVAACRPETAVQLMSKLAIWGREPDIPDRVYIRLVAKLYEARPTIVASSALGTGFVGVAAAWRSSDGWLFLLTAVTCALTIAIIPLLRRHRLVVIQADLGQAAVAERHYAMLTLGSAAGIGAMCTWALVASDNALIHLMLVALALSGVCTLLRNYFRARLVLWQLVAILVPPALGMIIRDDPLYLVVAIGGIILIGNMSRISRALYRQARSAYEKDEELRRQNLRFDAALNNMPHGLCMFDAEERLLVCNARCVEMYGLSADVVKPGIALQALLEHSAAIGNRQPQGLAAYRDTLAQKVAAGQRATFHTRLEAGRTIAVSVEPMLDGGWVATHEDITERLAAEAHIRHMARHDALTDLPNRLLFRERLEEALTRAKRGDDVALLCLDLDHFKSVNDTLGHPVGDALLRDVASRLQDCVRETDVVARFGGDEFAIVQVGADQPTGAVALAQRIIDALGGPYEIDGHQISVTASIGVSLAPGDGLDPDRLLKNADLALYRAKAEGRGRHRFFARDMDERMQARRALELDLRQAFASDAFALSYQPLVAVESNMIAGFEALLRWQHAVRGQVAPADFIPLAEEIGLVTPLGRWVLQQACATASAWPAPVRVAVNLSPAQFRTSDLVADVIAALQSSGLAAERLELEITEGVLLADNEATVATLHRLRALGVRIALGGFGTGYSSLRYLHSFPFDKIKIDRSFVHELSGRGEAAAIVRAITGLARSLGMSTTAEGIESKEQLDYLRREGCTEVQGHLLGKPIPAADAALMLRASIGQKFASELLLGDKRQHHPPRHWQLAPPRVDVSGTSARVREHLKPPVLATS